MLINFFSLPSFHPTAGFSFSLIPLSPLKSNPPPNQNPKSSDAHRRTTRGRDGLGGFEAIKKPSAGEMIQLFGVIYLLEGRSYFERDDRM